MKTILFMLAGTAAGSGLMFAIFPLISRYFVGPVHGEDQMSLNAAIVFIGVPACAITGTLAGFFIARHRRRKFCSRNGAGGIQSKEGD